MVLVGGWSWRPCSYFCFIQVGTVVDMYVRSSWCSRSRDHSSAGWSADPCAVGAAVARMSHSKPALRTGTSGLYFSSYAAQDPGFLPPESDTSFRLDPSVTPHLSSVTAKDWFTAHIPGQRPPWHDLRTSGLRARLPLT